MHPMVGHLGIAKLCAVVVAALAFYGSAQAQQRPFNKREMLEIVRKNSNDNTMSFADFANVIQQNGVDFEMSPQDESNFRKAGAANPVIELIRDNFRPLKSLVVRSTPGECQVVIDGQVRGTTSAAGVLVVRNIVGARKVIVRKQNYHAEERVVTVLPSGSVTNFFLSPLPGKLNVSVNVDDAQIVIGNSGTYTGKVADLELAPGSYDVEVSKPGYRRQSKTIVLSAGFPYSWPVTLEKMTVEQMLAAGEESLSRGQVNEAVATFHAALEEQPNNPRLIKLVGLAYFRSGNFDWSERYFANAISLGESVVFKVRHRHSPLLMCSGTITLSKKGFAFKSDSAYIEGHDFEITYDKFKEYFVADDVVEGARLHTKARVPKTRGRKGEDEKDNNFYVAETAQPTYRVCGDCVPRLNVIFNLMKQIASGAAPPSLDLGPGLPTLKRRTPDQR